MDETEKMKMKMKKKKKKKKQKKKEEERRTGSRHPDLGHVGIGNMSQGIILGI